MVINYKSMRRACVRPSVCTKTNYQRWKQELLIMRAGRKPSSAARCCLRILSAYRIVLVASDLWESFSSCRNAEIKRPDLTALIKNLILFFQIRISSNGPDCWERRCLWLDAIKVISKTPVSSTRRLWIGNWGIKKNRDWKMHSDDLNEK